MFHVKKKLHCGWYLGDVPVASCWALVLFMIYVRLVYLLETEVPHGTDTFSSYQSNLFIHKLHGCNMDVRSRGWYPKHHPTQLFATTTDTIRKGWARKRSCHETVHACTLQLVCCKVGSAHSEARPQNEDLQEFRLTHMLAFCFVLQVVSIVRANLSSITDKEHQTTHHQQINGAHATKGIRHLM